MLIFAHRGASAVEPENTLRAIKAAIAADCDGIEIDIFEVDERLLVIHDRYLQRTTSGTGLIYQQSFEQLRQLDAGKGEQIPTLIEVMALTANKCLLNIELKGVKNIILLLEAIKDAQRLYNFETKQLLLSSFNHHHLKALADSKIDCKNGNNAEFKIGALTASSPVHYAKFAQDLNAYSVHISIDSVNKEFVEDAHRRGLKVFVYTVDEHEDISILSAIKVDGIFANNPRQARKYSQQLMC